jgi:hypothetical protein
MALSEKQAAELRAYRAAMNAAAPALEDRVASQAVALYPVLRGDGRLVAAGTRMNWEGTLKRAAVDLWDREEFWPGSAGSETLWEEVLYRDGVRVIPEVLTAGLAFGMGERGFWPEDGQVYESLLAANVWTPSQHAVGWRLAE